MPSNIMPTRFGGGNINKYFTGVPKSSIVSPRRTVGDAGPPKDAGVAVRKIEPKSKENLR